MSQCLAYVRVTQIDYDELRSAYDSEDPSRILSTYEARLQCERDSHSEDLKNPHHWTTSPNDGKRYVWPGRSL